MKKIIVFVLFILISVTLKSQDLVSDFYAKYGENGKFTVVNISSKMFSLISDVTDVDTENIIKNLTGLKILKSGSDVEKYNREVCSYVNDPKKGYEKLMSVREDNKQVCIYIREVKNVVIELVIWVVDPQEFVIMGFTGKIDLKKISKLSKSVDVSGLEYLNKVDTSKNR